MILTNYENIYVEILNELSIIKAVRGIDYAQMVDLLSQLAIEVGNWPYVPYFFSKVLPWWQRQHRKESLQVSFTFSIHIIWIISIDDFGSKRGWLGQTFQNILWHLLSYQMVREIKGR